MKQLSTSIIFCSLFLWACSNNSAVAKNTVYQEDTTVNNNPKNSKAAKETEKVLKLDTFSLAPAGIIDGCGAEFATDSLNYAGGHMVYMSNLGENHLIKIDNHFILLKEAENKKIKDSDAEKIYAETLTGEGYTITIKTIWLKNDGDELSIYGGTLEITDGKSKISYNIYGGIGC